MTLIGKARHGIVRLRREFGAGNPARGIGLEHREPAAARQPMDQGGDEHRLAGTRQAGDTEPDRRVEEMLAIVEQRPRREARFLDDFGKAEDHQVCGKLGGKGGAFRAKVAIAWLKSSFTFWMGCCGYEI